MPISRLEPDQIDAVEAALDVKFRDRSLLEVALIHHSYVNEHPDYVGGSNERLEFLGDSIVGTIVADRLFTGSPGLPEGDLTVRRSQVVRRESLAAVARTIGLGQWLVMGNGEEMAGGAERLSNLADAFEAVVGAVYVDRGYRQAMVFVNRWLGQLIDDALSMDTRKDPKSLLQEFVQGTGSKLPRYQLIAEAESSGETVFTMEVVIDSESVAVGSGSRKIDAEREAAEKALMSLRKKGRTDR
ncbi:MAG: ribonuclease III [Chloroflexi bacterium]|nr:ribonuclease III [Chloroflexota bacterium]